MSAPRAFPGELLPDAFPGDAREPGVDADHRRGIHASSFSGQPRDEELSPAGRIQGQSETGAAADGVDGPGVHSASETHVPSGSRAQGLPLSPARSPDRPAGQGLVQRHHLYPPDEGFCFPHGGHGLVQPLCPLLGGVGDHRRKFLRQCPGAGVAGPPEAGDLQHRPGIPVHGGGFHRGPQGT